MPFPFSTVALHVKVIARKMPSSTILIIHCSEDPIYKVREAKKNSVSMEVMKLLTNHAFACSINRRLITLICWKTKKPCWQEDFPTMALALPQHEMDVSIANGNLRGESCFLATVQYFPAAPARNMHIEDGTPSRVGK